MFYEEKPWRYWGKNDDVVCGDEGQYVVKIVGIILGTLEDACLIAVKKGADCSKYSKNVK